MSSENFWELFTETGDIEFYLLYLKSNQIAMPCENNKIANGNHQENRRAG